MFFTFLNTALIRWFYKNHSTRETYVFRAGFVAINISMETLRGIRYKLRMMGLQIYGPLYIYGDNVSVIHNTQRPESTLKKNSNSILYHDICEYVAMGDYLTVYVGTNKNYTDLATEVLYGGKRRFHVPNLLYDIYDNL